MSHDDEQRLEEDPRPPNAGGGYVGGMILTGLFFLLVAALAIGALAAVGFAALAMPITTSLVLLFFLIAAIAGWRAKRRHDRAQRLARRTLDGDAGGEGVDEHKGGGAGSAD